MIRLRTGRAALFGAMLFLALVALLPMRLALGVAGLGEAGLTARAATGTLWSGRLKEARAAGLDLGDLEAGVSPLQLLLGRAHVHLFAPGDAAARSLRGAVIASRHAAGVEHLSATLPAPGVFQPLPVTALMLDDVSVSFRDGSCDRADGRVQASLAGSVAGVPLTGVMSGAARCDGGDLLLPLATVAGTEHADIRLHADGRYRLAMSMAAPDPATAGNLLAIGFIPSPGGYRLSIDGRL